MAWFLKFMPIVRFIYVYPFVGIELDGGTCTSNPIIWESYEGAMHFLQWRNRL